MATFLVVDDSMVMRTILRYMLERCGAKVIGESKDGEEAVAVLRGQRPDAITIAAYLRGESGIAALAAIRQSGWDGKIFWVASEKQPAEDNAGYEAGADGVLHKPFTLDEVSAEIKRVMASE